MRDFKFMALKPALGVFAFAALFALGRQMAAQEPAPARDPHTHWAFQPVTKPQTPRTQETKWGSTTVDSFVLAKLEEKHWKPAPPATRQALIRRVYFDVTGLPPSPEEVKQFVDDPSPQAYENLVDRLLSSRHYGEEEAQHWLDLVRYAESEGYEYDRHIPDAWRYRDYVIDSFNSDKPYDRFLLEQIAGDEVESTNPDAQTAVAFYRLGPIRRNAGNPDIALSRNEVLTERTDIIGSAFLGMTIGCARCHNHKLEPISQKDYYSFQAYLAATDEHNIVLAPEDMKRDWDIKSQKARDEIKRLQQEAKTAQGNERVRLNEKIEALEDELPEPLPTIPSTWNSPTNRTEIHVLKRGVWESKGELVSPHPPTILAGEQVPGLAADVSNPRTQLARWIINPKHPLTARVIVNRLWQQHFATGLVKTLNDFGLHGDKPSHPELLDWLAATLVENGWHLKPIHRLILLSSAYQQSATAQPEVEQLDPENRLLSHFNRRRLSAEEIRDAMLSASGRLNLKAGGPSVMVPVDPEMVKLLYKPSQWQPSKDKSEYDRRSIYLFAKRNLHLPFMETFDAPALLTTCSRRESSTHAPQALEMLNGKLSNDLAESLAQRLSAEGLNNKSKAVERAYWLVINREPSRSELEISSRFLESQPLKEFCLALFNLNDFLYVQ